jgi:hypothetical protein
MELELVEISLELVLASSRGISMQLQCRITLSFVYSCGRRAEGPAISLAGGLPVLGDRWVCRGLVDIALRYR